MAFYGRPRERSNVAFWALDRRRNGILAAVFNLNEPAHVVHWHFFEMSVSNIVVIVAMLVVFALAILLPFPGSARRQAARRPSSGGGLDGSPISPSGQLSGQPAPARIEVEP
ncbi:MAG: hypothetical protein ACRDK4_12965 [Solirubrobacteraceae bacterium]